MKQNTEIIMDMHDLLQKVLDENDISNSLYTDIQDYLTEIEGELKTRRLI